MNRVGVLLSGCGRYDGSESQEAVLVILALRRHGLRPVYLAPDVEQRDVVDHLSGDVAEGAPPRRVLPEAARLIRGVIQSLDEIAAARLDALVIPGGSGVVKNLLLPREGSPGGGALRPEVRRLLDDLVSRGAPIGAVGLADVIVARHQERPLDSAPRARDASEVVAGPEGGVLFAAGFMATDEITEAARGIDRLVEEIGRRLAGPVRPRSEG